MLNTARFAAIVDKGNLAKFRDVASVRTIKKNPNDTDFKELDKRREKMDAMLTAQIEKWTEDKDKYPDTFTMSFDVSEGCTPNTVTITCKKQDSKKSWSTFQSVFSLAHDKDRSESWQKIYYETGIISPEKRLKAFLKKADSEFYTFIKQNL
jgi:hypothetical protein